MTHSQSQTDGVFGRCSVLTMKRVFTAVLLFLCVVAVTLLHSTKLFRVQEMSRNQGFNNFIVRQLIGEPLQEHQINSEVRVTPVENEAEFIVDVDSLNGTEMKTSHIDIDLMKMSINTDIIEPSHHYSTSSMNYSNKFADLRRKPNIGIMEGLKKMRPEIMKDFPSSFLEDYKNPCYKKPSGGMLHCLPYFFLLGTPKSGTTDIWSKMIQHPDVVHAAKEPHWWTRKSYPKSPLSAYELRYMTRQIETNTRNFKARTTSVVTGDASASTFWDNAMWEQFFPEEKKHGPPYIIADLIHTILPDAKLIVTFRDPTDRLYSDYVYFHKSNTLSPGNFDEKVRKSINVFTKCTSENSLRGCAYSSDSDQSVRLNIGLYSIYARDWLQRYPRDQMMFIKLEEWNTMCNSYLPIIYKFLNLDSLPSSTITYICQRQSQNVNHKKVRKGSMWNSTRELLRKFYRPYVLDLADVVNETKFLWDY